MDSSPAGCSPGIMNCAMYNNTEKYTKFVFIMIDTVLFLVKNFEVEKNNFLTLAPGLTGSGKGCQKVLYRPLSRGVVKPVTGDRAFYNGRIVSATIFNMGFQLKSMMTVRVSAPKCLRLDNFILVEGQDLPEVYHLVTEELRGAGIHFDIMESKINRLDLARNFETRETPRAYIETLRGVDIPRMEKKLWETTLLFENGQQEIYFYDKIKEMKKNGLDTGNYPENVLRIEQRLKTGQKIKNSLGFSTGEDLINQYSKCAPWYEKNLEKHILKLNPDTALTGGNLKAEMKAFKESGGRNWFDDFKKIKGIQPLIREYGIDYICKTLREVELNGIEKPDKKDLRKIQTRINRFRKEAKRARQFSLTSSPEDCRRYKEIKDIALCL